MSTLSELQDWYLAQCNGDWEHEFGVSISTLDNPGWHLAVELADSWLEDQSFEAVEYGDGDIRIDSQSDELPDTPDFGSWIKCYVKDNVFYGYCGALKLEEVIRIFLEWARVTEEAQQKPEAIAQREKYLQGKSDRAYWNVLGDDVWQRECCVEGCSNLCARNVVRCRAHHFEFVRRRPYSYDG